MNTETVVHISARKFLKSDGWILIAGQYPGGSDDELPVLNIVDPNLARDNSPDHRRHSLGKFVPDIVAIKNGELLIVEAKPSYSAADKLKLNDLLSNHLGDLQRALADFQLRHQLKFDLNELKPVPCLAFAQPENDYPVTNGFAYIVTKSISEATYYPALGSL